jgi:hypothetical protein
MNVIPVILLATAFIGCLGLLVFANAPFGMEDERGFHYTDEDGNEL